MNATPCAGILHVSNPPIATRQVQYVSASGILVTVATCASCAAWLTSSKFTVKSLELKGDNHKMKLQRCPCCSKALDTQGLNLCFECHKAGCYQSLRSGTWFSNCARMKQPTIETEQRLRDALSDLVQVIRETMPDYKAPKGFIARIESHLRQADKALSGTPNPGMATSKEATK